MNGAGSNHLLHSCYYNGVPRPASPPRRADDKDGHYVFAFGETLTPRCNCSLHLLCAFFTSVNNCLRVLVISSASFIPDLIGYNIKDNRSSLFNCYWFSPSYLLQALSARELRGRMINCCYFLPPSYIDRWCWIFLLQDFLAFFFYS